MLGGIPHWVLGTSNAVCVGRHFYSASTIWYSVITIIHTFLLKGAVTNEDHNMTCTLLYQLLVFWLMQISALKSGPVSVLLPFLEGPRTGPVSESFRIQELRTRTAKNRKKPVVTGHNWSQNEYNKMRAISAKLGHVL